MFAWNVRLVTRSSVEGSSLVMTLIDDRELWVTLAGAAQRGDAAAWPAIIDRFEDLAVAFAVGLCGDLDEAPDIAQEAFVLAFRHIADLQDPSAFPAWLLRLVRTASNRRTRRRRFATVSLDAMPGDDLAGALVDGAAGPDEIVLATIEADEVRDKVRAAIERLPEGERCVVALHYLAGMPYAEVAAFLDITIAATKKRAWSARARLKELVPMVSNALTAARPSSSDSFRDTILLFQSIRNHDAEALAILLARNPTLATATLKADRRPETNNGDFLWTRIRAIDLFAPLRRGALVHIPPAYGLGAMRALYGMVDSFAPAHWWMIGFEHGPYEPMEFQRETSDSGTPATIDLIGPGHPADRRRQFAVTLERLATTPGQKVVTCVPAPGHEHDITVALPGLAADSSVLATFVVATYTSEPPAVPKALPEGFDARIMFDPARARARLWPAIEPGRTSTRTYPDTRHENLACAARDVLSNYAIIDPALALTDPSSFDDPSTAQRAQALVRYLSHSFRPFELLSASPAADTPMPEVLNNIEDLLGL